MKRKWIYLIVPVLALLLLSGCNMQTVDELYCLPKRSEDLANLQLQIDNVMTGLEYSAPISGENQQTVQMVDLNGDGVEEYILFAKGTSDNPLRIFIFREDDGRFSLVDALELGGAAFDQVEYVRMNDRPGYEMVVSCQVSDQVVRKFYVYAMAGDEMQVILNGSHSRIFCINLDDDSLKELLLLSPGAAEAPNGVAQLFDFENGSFQRFGMVSMSAPADKILRIIPGTLEDGVSAVFVASDVGGSSIITDVFAITDGYLNNVSLSSESSTSIKTLRNYYVYADDIDSDGVLELPALVSMKMPEDGNADENQYVIRWYSMTSNGEIVDKMYTYHNFVGDWYLELEHSIAERFCVIQKGNSFEFNLWDPGFAQMEKIMTVHVLTGPKREEQAVENNRFVLYRSDSTVYAANLEVASAAYNMTKESLISAFRLMLQDWKTGQI